jgi:Uma2 family endonuclease
MADDGAQSWTAQASVTDEEFARMAANGAFAGLGRWELRRGKLHRMSPTYHPHARALGRLYRALEDALQAAGLYLEAAPEVSVKFGNGFTPLADIVVCAGQHPTFVPGEAVKLVIEVADSSLADDSGAKALDYARAGLAEYMIADIEGRRFLQRTMPRLEGYSEEAIMPFGAALRLKVLPMVVIDSKRLVA